MSRHEPGTRPEARLLPVLAFSAAYLVVALAFYLSTWNGEFLYYISIILILLPLLGLLHRRVGLTWVSLWGLSLWGLLHMAGGLVPVPESWPIHGESRVLYSLWFVPGYLKYDHLIHAFGFGVATWVCWESLQGAIAGRWGRIQATGGRALLCVLAGLGLGATNEMLEFFAVLLLPETNVGGYMNTGWDLVSNAAGATIAALAIRLRG